MLVSSIIDAYSSLWAVERRFTNPSIFRRSCAVAVVPWFGLYTVVACSKGECSSSGTLIRGNIVTRVLQCLLRDIWIEFSHIHTQYPTKETDSNHPIKLFTVFIGTEELDIRVIIRIVLCAEFSFMQEGAVGGRRTCMARYNDKKNIQSPQLKDANACSPPTGLPQPLIISLTSANSSFLPNGSNWPLKKSEHIDPSQSTGLTWKISYAYKLCT